MNIGQLFELHLSMSLNDLKNKLKLFLKYKFTQSKIKNYLLNYIKIIDNTRDKWYIGQFKKQLKSIEITDEFIDNLSLIQAPFESITMNKCLKALKYTKTSFRYKIFDPNINKGIFEGKNTKEKGDYIVNEIACGYMYFFRMVHIAEEKLAARGIGSYTKKTLQPTSGKRNQGGQRLGEMEVACMIAHGSTDNLHESMTTKSDCIEEKNRWMDETIDSGNKLRNRQFNDSDEISESVRLLNSYLTVIGIDKD
jgi:DNA-directed RNA polymerase subunit beta